MRFDLITLLPELFAPFLQSGVTRRAYESRQVDVRLWNPRDFADGNYRRIDDRPFGGGPGMVMMAEPLRRCLDAIRADRGQGREQAPLLLFSPVGQVLNHALVDRVATGHCWTLVCGRYEGVDQRFVDQQVDELWSLGDFVLSGGEIAAMAVMDAAIRKLPGALGDAQSAVQESFSATGAGEGLLDWPHYTRPEVFQGAAVPDVLLSGHHERIADWRKQAARAATARLRPDLLAK